MIPKLFDILSIKGVCFAPSVCTVGVLKPQTAAKVVLC